MEEADKNNMRRDAFIHIMRIQDYIQVRFVQRCARPESLPHVRKSHNPGKKPDFESNRHRNLYLRQQLNSIVYHTIIQARKENGEIYEGRFRHDLGVV